MVKLIKFASLVFLSQILIGCLKSTASQMVWWKKDEDGFITDMLILSSGSPPATDTHWGYLMIKGTATNGWAVVSRVKAIFIGKGEDEIENAVKEYQPEPDENGINFWEKTEEKTTFKKVKVDETYRNLLFKCISHSIGFFEEPNTDAVAFKLEVSNDAVLLKAYPRTARIFAVELLGKHQKFWVKIEAETEDGKTVPIVLEEALVKETTEGNTVGKVNGEDITIYGPTVILKWKTGKRIRKATAEITTFTSILGSFLPEDFKVNEDLINSDWVEVIKRVEQVIPVKLKLMAIQ